MPAKICLIVDNPLRDLDGLVLLAWQLARRGAQVWLVPMYEQGFDVFALQPDWVVANYVRPNNLDLLRLYRRAGIRIAILDTEGAGGKDGTEFAAMVAQSGGADIIDLYCVWGRGQFDALSASGAVARSALRLTGCPRYDYCAPPWRASLPRPAVAPGYVLVNTNFPLVNPRFSRGTEDERRAMLQAGFSAAFASAYIGDARRAFAGMVEVMEALLERFPGQHFILRPHPFENRDAYAQLSRWPNFSLRQEGTSIEWINTAALLLHLNCSTAIEAAILGVDAVSPGWLDTDTLRVPGPSLVSRLAPDLEALCALLQQSLAGHAPAPEPELVKARAALIEEVYHAIDGKSAERVATALLAHGAVDGVVRPAVASPRGRLVHGLRCLLGHALSAGLRRLLSKPVLEERRQAKRFELDQVVRLLDRLTPLVTDGPMVRAAPAQANSWSRRRQLSGASIRIYADTGAPEPRA